MLIDPLPTIRRIDATRDDLFAFEVAGRITAADLENAYGLLEAAYAKYPEIDVLVKISDYEGFDWEALGGGTLKGKAQALKHVRRYAVVGGPPWMKTVLNLFGPFTSVESKHFDDEQEAWKWLGAAPVAG